MGQRYNYLYLKNYAQMKGYYVQNIIIIGICQVNYCISLFTIFNSFMLNSLE